MDIETAYKLMFTEYSDVLKLSELSTLLAVSEKTATKMLQQGKIEYKKLGREYRIPKINVIHYYLNEQKSI